MIFKSKGGETLLNNKGNKMKTLADFKRALVLGSKWEAFNHYYHASLGIRAVSKVQSTSFAFETFKDGQSFNSWADFPKAKNIEFLDENTVRIYRECSQERNLIMTYTKVTQ